MLRWLRSTLRGEVSIADLEARRRAGKIAYSLVEEADATEGDDRGACLFRVCAWNAFALQTIVDTLIDSDTRGNPGTAGFVPRSTLWFATACSDAVPQWIRCARMAQGDPDVRLAYPLPASLPPWRHDQPTTAGELRGLRAAYEALEPRVESALQAFAPSADPQTLGAMRRLLAEMTSAAEYAAALERPGLGPVDRGEVRWRLLQALRRALELGQAVAMPSVLDLIPDDAVEPTRTWLDVRPGWLVVGANGDRVGIVSRVRGDRNTGELTCIECTGDPDVDVTAAEIVQIRDGELVVR